MSKNFTLRSGQQKSIDYINQNLSVLSVLPTGYGKTIIGLEAVKVSKQKNQLAIFTTPLKALSLQMSKELKELGYKTTLDYGDDRVENLDIYNQSDVVVTTYERLDSILRSFKKRDLIKKELGYLIIDEIHNLSSQSRGQSVFSMIEKMKYHFGPKIVGLSATIGVEGRDLIKNLIKSELVFIPNEERPIPLKKIFLNFPYCDNKVEEVSLKFNLLLSIIQKNKDQKLLVLFSSRKLAEKISIFLRKSGISSDFHHAKRTQRDREDVEDRFKNGNISVLCCTTTLSQGLNLPCDISVVFDYKFYDRLISDYKFMERMDIDQFIGRAGRPGLTKNKYATAYFLVSSSDEFELKRVMGDDIEINIKPNFESLICDWITSDLYNDTNSLVVDLIKKYKFNQSEVVESLKFLIDSGLLIKDDIMLSATYEAKMATWFFVHPRVALAFRDLQESEEIKLLQEIVSKIPEIEDIVRYDEETDSQLINKVSRVLDGEFDFNFLKIVYYMFYETFETSDDFKNDSLFTENSVLSSLFGRYLTVGGIICKDEIIKKKIKNIQTMIRIKRVLNKKELILANLPNIGEKRFTNLMNSGINDSDKFLNTSDEKLSMIIGLRVEKIKDMKNIIPK